MSLRDVLSRQTSIVLRPVATEAQVTAFEAHFSIVLPPAYRAFLLEVGDGIDMDGEPWLYVLEDIAQSAIADRVDPGKPFWYGNGDAAAIRAAIAAVPPNGSVLGDAGVMALQRSGIPDGCLTLSCNGGNDFSVLVVTGEQRGRVWRTGELDHPESPALYDRSLDDSPLDFVAWFEQWAPCFLGVALGESD